MLQSNSRLNRRMAFSWLPILPSLLVGCLLAAACSTVSPTDSGAGADTITAPASGETTAVETPAATTISAAAVVKLATPTPESPAADIKLPTPTPTLAGNGGVQLSPSPLATLAPGAIVQPSPAPTPDGVTRSVRVPILMYHYLSVPPPDADIYRQDLSVPPELFAQQLDRLQAEGYMTINLYDLMAALTQGAALPPKPVIITFDDGYRDNYTNAFPLLKQHGMKATFFVLTDFMDEKRPAYLSWDMAREMLQGGMSIESHGRNHVSLKGKDKDYLVWQALGSQETLKFELGVQPHFVSYPAGEYDQNTIDIFKSANYWAAVTTQQGTAHSSRDPFELSRVRVRNTTTPDKLIALLNADW